MHEMYTIIPEYFAFHSNPIKPMPNIFDFIRQVYLLSTQNFVSNFPVKGFSTELSFTCHQSREDYGVY